MRWFRRHSSDRTLDDDAPQLLRLTSFTRRATNANTPDDNNSHEKLPAAPVAQPPPVTTGTIGGAFQRGRGRLPVNGRNGESHEIIHLHVLVGLTTYNAKRNSRR